MIKYYPLTRIKPNLYTRGNEYSLPDGRSYTGRYYLTYDNRVFTGINPVVGTNIELSRIQTQEYPLQAGPAPDASYTAATTQNTQRAGSASSLELTAITPYFPLPLESDYARGYFTRYFAKMVSGPGYVMEISQNDWSMIENGDVSPTMLSYEITNMIWQLTGPLNDKRVSQYQVKGGVYDTNKRVTEAKAKSFVGLVAFIGGDYTKFARITP